MLPVFQKTKFLFWRKLALKSVPAIFLLNITVENGNSVYSWLHWLFLWRHLWRIFMTPFFRQFILIFIENDAIWFYTFFVLAMYATYSETKILSTSIIRVISFYGYEDFQAKVYLLWRKNSIFWQPVSRCQFGVV